ncbi:MAG: AmmeMemoRadiSam system protein B [Desulfurococcales archaeon]|nr:AmmeMemoRadiSam system protein B [Desulfurococcales archaeon]
MPRKRRPAHAGTFYPSSRGELIKSIEDSFTHPLGPGKLPLEKFTGGRSVGYVVPHAGYMYSGPVAAHAYLSLARERRPSVVVIAGPNHGMVGLGAAVYKDGLWETPLGDVEVDAEVSRLIVGYSRFFGFDEAAHVYEHSVEVQVPFLQYIYGGDLRIVPITIGLQTLEVSRDLGEAVARVVQDNGVDLVFLASSDFNHYEPHDVTVVKDMKAIDSILGMDEERMYRVIETDNITMCGPAPVAALIHLAKRLGGGKPVLLKHATSGDVTGDKSWVVGYASIKFPKED